MSSWQSERSRTTRFRGDLVGASSSGTAVPCGVRHVSPGHSGAVTERVVLTGSQRGLCLGQDRPATTRDTKRGESGEYPRAWNICPCSPKRRGSFVGLSHRSGEITPRRVHCGCACTRYRCRNQVFLFDGGIEIVPAGSRKTTMPPRRAGDLDVGGSRGRCRSRRPGPPVRRSPGSRNWVEDDARRPRRGKARAAIRSAGRRVAHWSARLPRDLWRTYRLRRTRACC